MNKTFCNHEQTEFCNHVLGAMLDPVEQEARVPPRQETMNTSRHNQWEAEAPGRGIAPRVDQELAARVGTLGKRLGRPRLLRAAAPTPAWRFRGWTLSSCGGPM